MTGLRIVQTKDIVQTVRELCIEANHILTADMEAGLYAAAEAEDTLSGKQIMKQLQDNLQIARKEWIPICQDTGMAVVFIEAGQEVVCRGGSLEEAVQEGVRQGYAEGYLRNSVVADPLLRENTGDNTPAVIHYFMVPGSKLRITVMPKGFGSESMSRIFMLKPSDGREGVKNAILSTVKEAGANACPPMVVGVGIGGTFEKCALLAKSALLRPLDQFSPITHIRELEEELLEEINGLGIGPGGLGGRMTALAVLIETFPTHIAGLPVAVNLCCHANRHSMREL